MAATSSSTSTLAALPKTEFFTTATIPAFDQNNQILDVNGPFGPLLGSSGPEISNLLKALNSNGPNSGFVLGLDAAPQSGNNNTRDEYLGEDSNCWNEACIPLHNFSVVYRYISESRHSFMGSFDDPGSVGRGRYNEKMSPEVKISQWRKGSQWFEVNRKLAIDIVKDEVYYPKFKEFCKPPCYANEHYFPTMLHIQSPHLLENRDLTWVDRSRGGAHPATFGKADVTDKFLKKLTEGHGTCIYNNQTTSLCPFC
ncbi:hypothetical protein K7X08_004493 [Anisodus acutangulus]|uniref:Uncharacterized protein n=1 Tax=Anisodus acutangulus TaxID=402998 RepID=A0A9Q1RHU7_9SOLA|nr:hypothetical protein K7X08_004493 [Anisodus acutangulus]